MPGVSLDNMPSVESGQHMATILDLPDALDIDQLIAHWKTMSGGFVELLARYGSDVPALRHFGLLHWRMKRLDVAREAISAAVVLSPRDPRLWADLAGIYDGLSKGEAAESCIRRALDIDAGHAAFWQLLASLADRRGARDEAEAAYLQALRVDPQLGDAHFGLGILRFHQRRVDESAASLASAVKYGYANALGYSCLGYVLYRSSDFHACAAAFERAAQFGPLDSNARRQFARARTFAAIIDGRTDAALNAYPEFAGEDREDIATILQDAFSLLSAYGYQAAAIDIGRRRLAEKPDDPIRRYLLDAVAGRSLTSAPVDYIESYFDRFAPEFDQKLVGVLHYRVPQHLQSLIARHRDHFTEIVDLGCGTGLAAEGLAALGGRLTGVDLSGRMLDEAAKRKAYTALVKADVVAYLDDRPATFDLVLAADLLVYIGDLAPLMLSASRAVLREGIMALSIETAPSGEFTLLPSGRFAHAIDYVLRLASEDFDVLDIVETMIRLEANRPVEGHLIILRRR